MDTSFLQISPFKISNSSRYHVRGQDGPLLCCQVKVDQLCALNSKHADDSSPLYSRCPFAHRARIALKMADAPYELSENDLHTKPKWFLENVNWAGKVRRNVEIEWQARPSVLTISYDSRRSPP